MAKIPTKKYNVLIYGPIGSGKTHSLRSLLDCGHEMFVIATEPGIDKLLGDTDSDRCHWRYIPPASADWDVLQRNAELLSSLSMEALTKMKFPKDGYTQFFDVVNCCANFKCERTGQEFGAVDSWGPERVLIIDGLSGLSRMAMDLIVGAKPIKSLPEYGVAQDNLLRLINKLLTDTKCSFVLIAHAEREKDEISGGSNLKVSTIGNKLAPEIPKNFDEVVFARREGNKFFWSSIEAGVDTKVRCLPWNSDINPNFSQLDWGYDE